MDLFVGTIEWTSGDNSFLTNVWARGSHIGEAVERMLHAAKINEIEHAVLIDLDDCDFDDVSQDAIVLDGGNSFIDPNEYSFPTESSYKFPYGVIPTRGDDDEIDIDEIAPSYETWKDSDGLINVEAVVEREQLFDTYMGLVELLPDIRTFWLKISEDWEEFGVEETYTCEELTSSAKIRNFLLENWIDTVLNGHLILTTYADEGATNLNISDHKMLVLLTYDAEIAKAVCGHLKKLGLKKRKEMPSIARGVNHWHYRHPDGFDRKNLIRLLLDKAFKLWRPGTEPNT